MNETPNATLDESTVEIRQAEEARRHNELLEKLSMIDTAPEILQHLDDLAREIHDANQAEGAANKRGILNLIDYLDWLDFYNYTEEKQKLIKQLREDPAYLKFASELRAFEATIERLRLPFLVDRSFQFDRLNAKLNRLEGYTLTIS